MNRVGNIIDSIVEWPDNKVSCVYVTSTNSVYDGDTSDCSISVDSEPERARSKYLNEADEAERWFLSRFEENAVINRDDDAMFCECYSRTEEYCRYHKVTYVKRFEI